MRCLASIFLEELYIRSINNMVGHITNYLLQYRSISIPGLGTIYIERIPAQSDFVNHQLLPPTDHYRFDRYFDTPGRTFFSFLSEEMNTPEFQAIKQYNEWAQQLRNSLSTFEQPVVLEGIGSLHRDSSGDVVFEPLTKPFSYYPPVAAERIIRSNARHAMLVGDRETTTAEMSGFLSESSERRRSHWWVYALIAAALAIAAIAYYYYQHGSSAGVGNRQKTESR